MFEEVGLNEKAMARWHHQFETRHPEAHQSFLEWLGIGTNEVSQIRQMSR